MYLGGVVVACSVMAFLLVSRRGLTLSKCHSKDFCAVTVFCVGCVQITTSLAAVAAIKVSPPSRIDPLGWTSWWTCKTTKPGGASSSFIVSDAVTALSAIHVLQTAPASGWLSVMTSDSQAAFNKAPPALSQPRWN